MNSCRWITCKLCRRSTCEGTAVVERSWCFWHFDFNSGILYFEKSKKNLESNFGSSDHSMTPLSCKKIFLFESILSDTIWPWPCMGKWNFDYVGFQNCGDRIQQHVWLQERMYLITTRRWSTNLDWSKRMKFKPMNFEFEFLIEKSLSLYERK